MAGGLTTDAGGSIPTGLSPSAGVSASAGLSFQGFGGTSVTNGILLEDNTSFLMLENGTDILLQE